MLDFHSHILPGLDDGAPDLATAIEMARIAVADGITEMVATPHYIEGSMENNRKLIVDKVEQFQQALDCEEIPLKILPGSEVYLSPKTPELLKQGDIMTINDKCKHLLLELPMQCIPNYLEDVLFEIKLQGVTPIIAHPERNIELGAKPEKILELARKGCLLQLNAGSFNGFYGNKTKKTAELLARNGLVHLLGSDAHSADGRAPRMRKALMRLDKLDLRKREIFDCGSVVIQGIPITPEIIQIKRSFWKRVISFLGIRF